MFPLLFDERSSMPLHRSLHGWLGLFAEAADSGDEDWLYRAYFQPWGSPATVNETGAFKKWTPTSAFLL
jgi:hypothetical protein